MEGRDTLSISLSQSSTTIGNSGKRTRTKVYTRFNEIWRSFCKPKGSAVKLEYLSASLIRGLKKAMRNPNRPQGVRLIKFSRSNETALSLWNELKELFKDVPSHIASTESDPSNFCQMHRSFSRPFVRQFFADFNSKPIFSRFLELVFLDRDCKSFCERFQVQCCQSPSRNCCEGKWREVEKWLANEFIQELEEEAAVNSQSTQEYEREAIFEERPDKFQILEGDEFVESVLANPNTIG